jgi:tight adherence protein B
VIGVNVVEPTYFDEVMESSVFIPACLVVGFLLVLNLIVMRALVNIKV